MKRWSICLVAVATFLMLLYATDVKATETDVISSEQVVNTEITKPILALGADLTEEQRETVLSLMDIAKEDLSQYLLIDITNEMEHQYLGEYLDASVIGTKSLSSVLITPKESGYGVVVTTKNINYCTVGMYRNALLTAGVSDAKILVAAPSPMSGTAALIGAVKGYEAMTGVVVEEVFLDTAMDELITTGEIAEEIAAQTGGDSGKIEELIAFVKAKVAAGELETEEDVRAAIKEGEAKFDVTLTEDQVQQVVDVMMKIHDLGLDPQMLIEQAEDLYGQFGADFLDNLDSLDTEAIGEEVQKQVTEGFISLIIGGIKEFFAGIFS